MNKKVDSLVIEGIEYVPKDTVKMAEGMDDYEYVICRTYSAGVFAGYLKSRNGKEVTLLNARRLWYWDGAASLSQLAMEGTSKPGDCRFPCEVKSVDLMEAIEILPCTQKAKDSIAGVGVWKM